MAAADVTDSVPGWYGKLPALGDFASRRWPQSLIDAWDRWLAQGLTDLRDTHADAWLPGYLDSPTWRFLLAPGVLGAAQPRPLAGVLMPSVDRAGRYFPFTIAAPLRDWPVGLAEGQALLTWLHALDDIAADALQDDWDIAQLEAALADMPAPHFDAGTDDLSQALVALTSGSARCVSVPLPPTRDAALRSLGQGLARRGLAAGTSWWWAEPDSDPQRRQVWLAEGLPTGDDFARLLGGHTHAHPVAPIRPAHPLPP